MKYQLEINTFSDALRFSFPLGIFMGNSSLIGVKDKTFISKEAPAKQGKVWIYIPTVILSKSLLRCSFQNKKVLALPKALPWTVTLADEVPVLAPLPLPSPKAQNALSRCFSQESTGCFPAVGMTKKWGQDPGRIYWMMNRLQLFQALSSLATDGVKQERSVHHLGAFWRELICSQNQILHFQLQLREDVSNGLFAVWYFFPYNPRWWICILCPRSQNVAAAFHEPSAPAPHQESWSSNTQQ